MVLLVPLPRKVSRELGPLMDSPPKFSLRRGRREGHGWSPLVGDPAMTMTEDVHSGVDKDQTSTDWQVEGPDSGASPQWILGEEGEEPELDS